VTLQFACHCVTCHTSLCDYRFFDLDKFVDDAFPQHHAPDQPPPLPLRWTCFSMRDATVQRCMGNLLWRRKFAPNTRRSPSQNLPLLYTSAYDVSMCLERRIDVARIIDCLSEVNIHYERNNLRSRLFKRLRALSGDVTRMFNRQVKRRPLANTMELKLPNRAVNRRFKLTSDRHIWFQKRRWGETLSTCITSYCTDLFGESRVRCIVHRCNKQIRG